MGVLFYREGKKMNSYKSYVDSYLASHPNGDIYNTIKSSTQQGVVTLATEDIMAYLGSRELSSDDSVEMGALSEQVLWILERNRAKKSQVSSESIDGVGSRSYELSSQDYSSFIAPRAMALLESRVVRYVNSISRG